MDTCRAGMTCIEDYSDSTMRGMTRFYQALDELAKAPRPVRIAYFGDSFIEADILTADLREMLQQKYGGCGVGFCHHYVHDQWLPSYSASFLQRMAESFCHGLRVL